MLTLQSIYITSLSNPRELHFPGQVQALQFTIKTLNDVEFNREGLLAFPVMVSEQSKFRSAEFSFLLEYQVSSISEYL
jgi:hypothetical protein